MSLFNDAEEQARRQKLSDLEDKRLRFAEEAARRGFSPDRMLMLAGTDSRLFALARQGGELWLVRGPAFGSDEDFRLEKLSRPTWRVEDHHVAPEGLGGLFGMGKKGEHGVKVILTANGEETELPLIAGGGCGQLIEKKNPLLSTKRRRGNANLVWDLPPLENKKVEALKKALLGMLEG